MPNGWIYPEAVNKNANTQTRLDHAGAQEQLCNYNKTLISHSTREYASLAHMPHSMQL